MVIYTIDFFCTSRLIKSPKILIFISAYFCNKIYICMRFAVYIKINNFRAHKKVCAHFIKLRFICMQWLSLLSLQLVPTTFVYSSHFYIHIIMLHIHFIISRTHNFLWTHFVFLLSSLCGRLISLQKLIGGRSPFTVTNWNRNTCQPIEWRKKIFSFNFFFSFFEFLEQNKFPFRLIFINLLRVTIFICR